RTQRPARHASARPVPSAWRASYQPLLLRQSLRQRHFDERPARRLARLPFDLALRQPDHRARFLAVTDGEPLVRLADEVGLDVDQVGADRVIAADICGLVVAEAAALALAFLEAIEGVGEAIVAAAGHFCTARLR